MILSLNQSQDDSVQNPTESQKTIQNSDEEILCNHCLRARTNGIRCIGKCVSDNDF